MMSVSEGVSKIRRGYYLKIYHSEVSTAKLRGGGGGGEIPKLCAYIIEK